MKDLFQKISVIVLSILLGVLSTLYFSSREEVRVEKLDLGSRKKPELKGEDLKLTSKYKGAELELEREAKLSDKDLSLSSDPLTEDIINDADSNVIGAFDESIPTEELSEIDKIIRENIPSWAIQEAHAKFKEMSNLEPIEESEVETYGSILQKELEGHGVPIEEGKIISGVE